ncbi:antitoxin [uncultured Jatrophihabitans sp.]|uniref:antitoxin n=1 Tax=uncultured Jatrophihabitans sp. TaxID=1610747 RepID=UPI0035CC5A28
MRTTIDLPEPLLDQLRAIARDSNRTLSAVVVDYAQRGMRPVATSRIVKGRSGFPALASNGRVITTEDVRSLEDEW